MALNDNYNLARLPILDIPRSRFDKSHSHKTTFNVSDLIPVFVDEIIPGTTINLHSNKLVRLQTLLYPLMDNLYLDEYYFFVPMRLLMTHFRELMGENTQGAWYPEVDYSIPTISTGENYLEDGKPFGFPVGSVADHFGIPINTFGFEVNALPLRAYALIWNEFFRDENLSDPVLINLGDGDQDISEYLRTYGENDYRNTGALGLEPLKVAKYKDLFTTMLPAPQKGPVVTIPFDLTGYTSVLTGAVNPDINIESGIGTTGLKLGSSSTITAGENHVLSMQDGMMYADTGLASGTRIGRVFPTNLYANFDEGNNVAGGFTVNALRLSVAAQKLLETDARYGTRYTELLSGHFGLTPADSRLQRPEFIGGSHFPLSIDQVVQMSETSDSSPLGETGAYSVTAHSQDENMVYSAQEHGYVIGVACVRYEHSYSQALDKMWNRRTKLNFYFPEFSNIGEVGVEGKELVYQGKNFDKYYDEYGGTGVQPPEGLPKPMDMTDDMIVGYQEAWYDYRYKRNYVTGEFHSGIDNTLDAWHLSDYYDIGLGAPALDDEWIREDGDIVNRVIAVSDRLANQILLDMYFEYEYVAPLPVYSIPSLTDIRG